MKERTEGGSTLWHGRFEDGPSPELLAFSESLRFRTYPRAITSRKRPKQLQADHHQEKQNAEDFPRASLRHPALHPRQKGLHHGFELASFNASNLIYRKEQMLAPVSAHLGANVAFNNEDVAVGTAALAAVNSLRG